jgi:hypothetical protein
MRWLALVLVGCASSQSLPDRVASGAVHSPMELVGETANAGGELRPPMQRGRVWVAAGGSPIAFELLSDGRPIGVVAELDPGGNVTAMRIYADLTHAHPRSAMPFEGREISTGHGSQAEVALVAKANESWAGMNAHSAAQTLASAAPRYTLVDFSAPTVLDRRGTEDMVGGFLNVVGDFHVTSRVQFAAGTDVISENVEHMTLNGKPLELHALDIKRIENGVVVKEWQYANGAEIRRALAAK